MDAMGVLFISIFFAIVVYKVTLRLFVRREKKRFLIKTLCVIISIVSFFSAIIFLYAKWGQEGQKKEDETTAKVREKCNLSPVCYAQQHHNPIGECMQSIESKAKYYFKWKSSITNPAFVSYAWNNSNSKLIEMYGNTAQAQNGYGAYQNVRYSCLFNADTGEIISSNFE